MEFNNTGPIRVIKEEDQRKALEVVLNTINKQHGKGSIFSLKDKEFEPCEAISTGSLGVDTATGVGGVPLGRIVEVFGPESCLAEDTILAFEVWSKDGKTKRNHKGGTIQRLFERFHQVSLPEAPKQGRHLQNNDSKFYIKSVNEENCIVRNEILDVVSTGIKRCFKLETTTGQFILATQEHKFLTGVGYKELGDLHPGDDIFVHVNTRVSGKRRALSHPTVCVKFHPFFPPKLVNKKYLYYRSSRSRLAYEAYINNMSLDQYVAILNTQDIETINKLRFIPKNLHIHHRDENFLNDNIDNLDLIDPASHGKLHSKDRLRNLSFIASPTKVKSIELIGERPTYDLKCAYPYNNYIANKFVVHNSGKTSLCLHIIANAQKRGGACAFIDTEHALDLSYAKSLGVDVEKMVFSQPDFGEQALDIVEALARSGSMDVIVVDSVAALVPKSEIEGNMGDSHMGLQARLMSQACRKLAGVTHKTNTLIIFTNQLRSKIGIVWGNPEVTCVAPDTKVEIKEKNYTNTKSVSIMEIFNIVGVDPFKLQANDPVDISDKKIKIRSYDHKIDQVVWRTILALVRKEDSEYFGVFQEDILVFKGSPHHKVYDIEHAEYFSLLEVSLRGMPYFIGQGIKSKKEFQVRKLEERGLILDLMVEDTENYFANGVLSHNTGGNALKFYASMRLDIRRVSQLKSGTEDGIRGNRTKVKIVKNKLAPPFREAEFDILFGKGIDYLGEVVDLAIANGVITRAGSWYSYGEQRLGQGAPMIRGLLEANPDMLKDVLTKIDIAQANKTTQVVVVAVPDEEIRSDS